MKEILDWKIVIHWVCSLFSQVLQDQLQLLQRSNAEKDVDTCQTETSDIKGKGVSSSISDCVQHGKTEDTADA